jgi:hypothetical protein
MSMLAAFMGTSDDRTGDGRRRRRVVAWTLAAVVTVGAAAGIVLVAGTRDEAPRVSAYVAPRVLTVWPESAIPGDETPADVQASVDEGDPDLRWRTDPTEVVHAFVASVLGWSDAAISEQYPGLETPRRWYTATGPSCPGGATRCPHLPGGNHPTLRIEVIQPARRGPGGIWSVSTVRSSGLRLATAAEDPYASGSIRGVAARAAGLHTLAGARWYDGCDAASEVVDDVRRPSRFRVALPGVGSASAGCGEVTAGYAYAYAVTGETQPTGDPLLESSSIVDLTVVPILVRLSP